MILFYQNVFRLSQVAAAVAAMALVFMVGLITVEIVLRTVFSTSTFVVDEFVGYAVALCILWSLGYVLEHGKLIRVSVLTARLSPRVQDVLTAAAALIACLGSLALMWMFWLRTARAWSRGTVSSSVAAVPTWLPEGLVMIGMGLLALQLLAHGLRHLTGHPSPARADDGDEIPSE